MAAQVLVEAHGKSSGHVNDQYLGDLIEAASILLGNAPAEHERRFIAGITALLAEVPHASEAGGRGRRVNSRTRSTRSRGGSSIAW
jgi:hypothetical protein